MIKWFQLSLRAVIVFVVVLLFALAVWLTSMGIERFRWGLEMEGRHVPDHDVLWPPP